MEALVNVDSSLICARIIQVFVGAFFYIFMIAKAVGSENKAKWFKRRGIFGEYINFGYPITWQGVGIFVAIYGVIFGFGYWYVFIHAYN